MDHNLIEKKILFFHDVIQKIVLNIQHNKRLDILAISDVNACILSINAISIKLNELSNTIITTSSDIIITQLQNINNEIAGILKIYGSESLEDLLNVCFGNINSIITKEEDISKFDLLKKYFHPTGYKVIVSNKEKEKEKDKEKTKKHNLDDFVKNNSELTDNITNLDCANIAYNEKQFHVKVYGIKLYIYHASFNKNIIIQGVLDDVIIDFLNNKYINSKISQLKNNAPSDEIFNNDIFINYISSLSLKDYLVYQYSEIYNNYIGYINQYKILKQKSLSQISKDFISAELYAKRNMLIILLINSINYDNKYIAYLLYDILSYENNGTSNADTKEQIILFDSFSISIKQYFKNAMKEIIKYTTELSNFDINKIPLEQQICLLKTSDSVKEKAMTKLKEIKAKSEDSGSKARQYLDGLLKIPFNIFIKEPILHLMNDNRTMFNQIIKREKLDLALNIPIKPSYTHLEIIKYIKSISPVNKNDELLNGDKNDLINIILKINELILNHKLSIPKIKKYSSKTKSELKQLIIDFIKLCSEQCSQISLNTLYKSNFLSNTLIKDVEQIESNFQTITTYIHNVKSVLDSAIHGHDNAKSQIECIIAQWITGEQDGHCFGFEGPPGVGKTSLAKRGLSNCLKDADGNSRPFSFIQMGGDSNGSTLHGHNYTYVGSTWGSIVQILMDKKCMNPIIFIDELDKISKTEHGREIIGILTHLLDPTQNDSFQDKYFNGIDLDLSKALFVLSYNDVSLIDKTLLDRIHRIKFTNLSLEDKLVISKSHILPEIYKKMGLENMIYMDDVLLTVIIEEYTCEPGVRKLKEILYEIVGEINIDILKNKNYDYDFLIKITVDDLKDKYFKDKYEVILKKVHTENIVGIANGMWANSVGQGGVIPIQSKFYPTSSFLDLKLTGMQGDVMKESMNVALTLAWNLTDPSIQKEISEKYGGLGSDKQKYGIHINTPEASVQKDGPSAGSCITTVIYSLLNNKKIKCNMAMTGEISLNGQITAIGGLDLKILGSIKSGVTDFIYPEENTKDFNKFMKKYKDSSILTNIHFYPVKHISQVFELIFE
jgi:ATP-dependent Lon protease